jgi:RHS repeat-associated protein
MSMDLRKRFIVKGKNFKLADRDPSEGGGTVYWDDFSLSDPIGPGGGQQFGYDGFGNLLSQSAIFGSSPFMSLAVNPNTNQVTGTGVVFDAAGNMTQDGGVSYGYDSMNRLTSAGTASFSYSPGENKRMVVYSNISPTPQLNIYLYGPNGKVLSKFLFEPSGSAWDAVPGSQTNYFYLGGKALNWAENNVGSTTASQFWPYGQTVGGGVFATYQPDLSGFLYADQRYYNSGWGRFLTADPSNANIDPTVSGSYNRYTYVNGDPTNAVDANGLGGDGPGEGCVYETADSIVCFAGPPDTGGSGNTTNSDSPATTDPASQALDSPIVIPGLTYTGEGVGIQDVPTAPSPTAGPSLWEIIMGGLGEAASGLGNAAGALAFGLLAPTPTGPADILPSNCPPSQREATPDNPGDQTFVPLRGQPCKVNQATGEVWCKDKLHGDHWEVYLTRRAWQRGTRSRAVWNNGCVRDVFKP